MSTDNESGTPTLFYNKQHVKYLPWPELDFRTVIRTIGERTCDKYFADDNRRDLMLAMGTDAGEITKLNNMYDRIWPGPVPLKRAIASQHRDAVGELMSVREEFFRRAEEAYNQAITLAVRRKQGRGLNSRRLRDATEKLQGIKYVYDLTLRGYMEMEAQNLKWHCAGGGPAEYEPGCGPPKTGCAKLFAGCFGL